MYIMQILDVGTKERLYILFGVIGYLLKMIILF